MTRFTFFVALFMTIATQLAAATFLGPLAYDGRSGNASPPGYSPLTEIPIAPVTIVPETDFIPVSNVWPVVNIFPTDFNDYSYDIYSGYPPYPFYGGYPPFGGPVPF